MAFWEWIYGAMLFGCSGYASVRGGRDEWFGAGVMVGGSIATALVAALFGSGWSQAEYWILAVDLLALLALIHLVLTTRRYWPIWAAAFHLVTVSVHVATMVAPHITPKAFATGAAFWAYPMLLALALGAHEHQATEPTLIR